MRKLERARVGHEAEQLRYQRIYPVGSVLKVREETRGANATERVEARCGISDYDRYVVRVADHSVLTLPFEISSELSDEEIIETEGPYVHVKPMDDERPTVELLRPDRIIERID